MINTKTSDFYGPADSTRRVFSVPEPRAGCPDLSIAVTAGEHAQKAGAETLRDIAAALNARGIATAPGGRWYATSVKNVLDRPAMRSAQTGQR